MHVAARTLRGCAWRSHVVARRTSYHISRSYGSIGGNRASAFVTIRYSCQQRGDWSRVKDRLNHLWVRVVFAPYLPLSFRVQRPGDQPACRGFDYRGRGTYGAVVARSSCCVWRADCEIGYQACGSWKYQPRFAGLVRCEADQHHRPRIGASHWDWHCNSLGGDLPGDDLRVQGPSWELPCAATWRYQALPVISQWLTNGELCWERPS